MHFAQTRDCMTEHKALHWLYVCFCRCTASFPCCKRHLLLCAVNGMARAEAGAVHVLAVPAAASSTGHQHSAVCIGRRRAITHFGPDHTRCQSGCAAHGDSLCSLHADEAQLLCCSPAKGMACCMHALVMCKACHAHLTDQERCLLQIRLDRAMPRCTL